MTIIWEELEKSGTIDERSNYLSGIFSNGTFSFQFDLIEKAFIHFLRSRKYVVRKEDISE